VALLHDLWIPDRWRQGLEQRYHALSTGRGDKALAVVGAYGSGKTYVLQWMRKELFEKRRRMVFFFDNPGVAFYDLANQLLRQVGRYEMCKGLYELLAPKLVAHQMPRLITLDFPEWLRLTKERGTRQEVIDKLSTLMRVESLTDDEEIAHRLARMLVETGDRPYFEYRDFVPGRAKALVAEREEARYFGTLIRLLRKVYDTTGVVFLIDEFEDVALQHRLNRKQAHDYLATLRRLLNLTMEEELWVVVSMTPEALEQTRSLEASLVQRFVQPFEIPPLNIDEASDLVERRLKPALAEEARGRGRLWPFAEDALADLEPTTFASPRRVVKVCWQAIAFAVQRQLDPPIPARVFQDAEQSLYPAATDSESQ
jgi:hypothetical protein